MKTIWTLIALTLLTACGITFKSVKKRFNENPVAIFTNLDNAIASKKSALLFIVFNDGDTETFNSPITKVLKIDTTKADASIYESLSSEYAVIKLYNSEFRALINNLDEPYKTEASEYNPNKTFAFISLPQKKFMPYGKRTLDNKEFHTIISNKFGP